jgi:hypothetical protein
MYVPRLNSRREQLIDIVNKSRGVTVEIIVRKYGMLGFPDPLNIAIELRKLVKLNSIKEIGDIFFPAYKVKPSNIYEEVDIVPPRSAPPFKPLKTFPPTVSPRGQPIERRSFKTCKSNVRYQSKNDI